MIAKLTRRALPLLAASVVLAGTLGIVSPADASTGHTTKPSHAQTTKTASPSDNVKFRSASTTDTVAPEQAPSCDNVNMNVGNGDCSDVITNESYAAAMSTTDAKVVSLNGVNIHSNVTVLSNVRVHGTPKRLQTDCFRTDKPMSIWTSYNPSGLTGWHWKDYPKGKRFCNIAGKVRDPNCHNIVDIGRPKSSPPKGAVFGKVKIVKKFHFKVVSVSKIADSVTASAGAWANAYDSNGHRTCHAESHAKGAASFFASARAVVRGSVLVKVLAQAKAASVQNLSIKLQGQSKVSIHADTKTRAKGKAMTKVVTKAVCATTTPPGTPEVEKPTLSATRINDVEQGGFMRNFKVDYNVPGTDPGTLLVNATYGKFVPDGSDCSAPAVNRFSVTGNGQLVLTYCAPMDGSPTAPTTDTVTVTLRDETTGSSADPITQTFATPAPATHP